jgi:hypothetical protein
MKRKMTNNEMPRGRPDVTNPLLILTLLAVLTCPVAVRAQSAAPSAGIGQEVTNAADELTWPRESEVSGTKVDTYQPQMERRAGTNFETRSAVAITSADSNAPVYGVFWSPAPTQIDKPTPAQENVEAHAALQQDQKLTTQIELRAQETLYVERPAPNEKSLGRFKLDGILVQLFKTDHLFQLINPAAPERYGSAEDNVVRDLTSSKVSGLKFLELRF